MRYWTCAVIFYFQLSRVYPLWHGGHGPLTPDPSPPFHGGEGGEFVFLSCRRSGIRRSSTSAVSLRSLQSGYCSVGCRESGCGNTEF